MTDFGKVAVLMGGRSAERDISLRSGSMVLEALVRQGVDAHAFDPKERRLEDLRAEGYMCVFIALHGRFGEDGTVQGALECMGIPYTGSGVMGSAIAMDKLRTKLIWTACGIPTPKHALIDAGTDAVDLVKALGLPLIVKPIREGSSIGVTKVTSVEQVGGAYELASGYDDVILAEQFVVGAEYTAAVLDGKALPLIRIEAPAGNYDYQNKYYGNETHYHCPCGLDPVREKAIQDLAIAAFDAVGCRGWGRLDLMLDAAGNPWFLEVNTVPGMTDHSLVPMAARAIGISFDELVLRILSTAGES